MRWLSALMALASLSLLGCASAPKVDNSVVPSFDLARYLGDWHEIARFELLHLESRTDVRNVV